VPKTYDAGLQQHRAAAALARERHREQQRERRRRLAGWKPVPSWKDPSTLLDVAHAVGSPCYEVFHDADGLAWMRRVA
jgi:hypothetical protein